MKRNILYLALGLWCIGFTACTHDSDEPNPVLKDELSRSTITVEKTVTLAAPGTLQEKVEEAMAGEDVSTLQKLTIVGPYNGKDVQYWKTALTNLIVFDLKEAVPTQSDGEQYEYLDPYGNTMYQNNNVIGPHSFSFMEQLEAIVFPDCIETIKYEACNGCINLLSVTFGDNLITIDGNAFQSCTMLDNVVLPESLKTIRYYAFYGSGISSIKIPSSVIEIDNTVFCECSELKNVELLANIKRIPDQMFLYCSKLETITLSSSIKEIGTESFEGCISLKSFPFSQIEKINHRSFHQSGLEEVDLSNVTDFSNASWSFRLCESLKKVILPDNVTSLANTMFWGCSSLKEMNIPSTLETINDELLGACGFTEITIPSTVKYIGSNAFASNIFLETVELPDNLESIGNSCFAYCENLSSVKLPSDLKEISDRMFFCCYSLKSIELPNGLEKIVYGAFADTGLESIEIPASVTTIEDQAFRNSKLKSLVVPETVVNATGRIIDWCRDIQYVVWNSPGEVVDIDNYNTNCYLYLANENIGCGPNWNNVIININGEYVAESVTLCEGGQRDNQSWSYSVPIGFKAKKIRYERRFGDYNWQGEYFTHPGECSGWQTIVLPFKPDKIEHETKGEVAPFNSPRISENNAKPFWLRELTATGWEDKTTMEANKPYIIAMPNHDSYLEDYRLYGKITFSAKDVTLSATSDGNSEVVYPASVGPEYDLQPTYHYVERSPMVYALNTTYWIDGYNYGSVFAKESSDVYAFEAYVSVAGRLARSTFGIDTSSSNTRSTKEKNTTGIPQIGDM